MYRGWTQTEYKNKHYNINQKDEGTQDDRGRAGESNFILRIKEQETRLILHEHDDDDDDDDEFYMVITLSLCVLYGSQNKQQIFLIQHSQTGFYNRGGECLQLGTN